MKCIDCQYHTVENFVGDYCNLAKSCIPHEVMSHTGDCAMLQNNDWITNVVIDVDEYKSMVKELVIL